MKYLVTEFSDHQEETVTKEKVVGFVGIDQNGSLVVEDRDSVPARVINLYAAGYWKSCKRIADDGGEP